MLKHVRDVLDTRTGPSIRGPGPGNSSAAIVTGTGKGVPLCDGWRLPVGARPIYISLEIGVETLSHPYLEDT
jgi:hypothetical protein